MKATQFIKDHGLERAREVVDGAPDHSQFVIPCLDGEMYFSQREDGKWFKWSNGYNKWLEYFGKCDPLDLAYSLLDVERLVESVDLVKAYGGIEQCRKNAEWVVKTRLPKTDLFKELQQAIADYELIYGEEGASHE
ncbi:hypothetical protein ACOY72_14540 [Acinetobacter seifertii]|uniref:hypothetical protein n=1 Tax=Acinetobacter seifertii TaxID=1530123 RepID=UPI003BE88398